MLMLLRVVAILFWKDRDYAEGRGEDETMLVVLRSMDSLDNAPEESN
jgi:hypothetical protein